MLLRCENITKNYPSFTLGPLSLDLEPGMIKGFAGPNGAGKTTTIKILMGLIRPTSGQVWFNDQPLVPGQNHWKSRVGFVGEPQSFFDGWTVYRNLEFFARVQPFWDMDRAEAIAKRLDLDLKKKVASLSTGNRVKLALVSAMAHHPKLLVLDEPTSGLDPVTRSEVLDLLREFASSDEQSVLFSTHIIPDLAKIADDLTLISKGRIIRSGAPDDLINCWRRVRFNSNSRIDSLPGVVEHLQEGSVHRIVTRDWEGVRHILDRNGAVLRDVTRISLDEAAVFALKGEAA